jgi:uncharacterized protein (DUF58 family)
MSEAVRRLARLLETRAAGVLAGAYRSSRRGAGLAFAELRPYTAGEDARAIDWKVTARQRRPYVRVYEAERSQALWLVVDGSASLGAGAPGRAPGDFAREAAGWLAAAAWHNGDRVGLVAAGDRVVGIEPRAGRRQVGRIGTALGAIEFTARGVDLGTAVEPIARTRRRALVVVLGDFRDRLDEEPWRLLARRHELWPIRIVDAREANPPRAGLVAVFDAETGRRGWIDLGRDAERASLRDRSRRCDERFLAWCRGLGVGGAIARSDEPALTALVRALTARSRRRLGRADGKA